MQDIQQLRGKRVLVTGGAGFVGCHLCEALVKLGCQVMSVDDLSAGKEHNYSFMANQPNFSAHKVDITDREALLPLFKSGVEIVFHNAASKKTVCLRDPQRDLAVNAGGALTLLQLSREFGVKKFLHASTGSVYGEPKIFPTNEEHPLYPVSYYGVSKLAGERYVGVFDREHGLDTTILRYFHVYGSRQESNEFGGVVSIFLRNILEGKDITIHGDGSQLRSFTWVNDIVTANLLAAVTPAARGQVYNCASGIQVSIKELAEGIMALAGSSYKGKINYDDWVVGDIKFFDVDNSKIRSQLGLEFSADFWGKMKETFEDFVSYLKRFDLAAV